MQEDIVNHPKHYTSQSITLEPIDMISGFNFCVGNALKYIIRAGHKGPALVDFQKAEFYLNYFIQKSNHKTGDMVVLPSHVAMLRLFADNHPILERFAQHLSSIPVAICSKEAASFLLEDVQKEIKKLEEYKD